MKKTVNHQILPWLQCPKDTFIHAVMTTAGYKSCRHWNKKYYHSSDSIKLPFTNNMFTHSFYCRLINKSTNKVLYCILHSKWLILKSLHLKLCSSPLDQAIFPFYGSRSSHFNYILYLIWPFDFVSKSFKQVSKCYLALGLSRPFHIHFLKLLNFCKLLIYLQ